MHRRLDPIGGRMPLPDGGPGRDADDDVREGLPPRLPEAEPAQVDGRVERRDRPLGGGHLVRRRPVHQHVDVASDEPRGGGDDEQRDEQRGDPVRPGVPGARREQPDDHRERADEVARRNAVRWPSARRCRIAARSEPRRSSGRRRSRSRPRRRRASTTRRARPSRSRPVSRSDREHADRDADEHEKRRLDERREVLRLAVPVEVRRVGGPRATPTANSVSSAATRSVPECSASATSPSEPLGIPAASLTAISRQAATTETSAVRRCAAALAAREPGQTSRQAYEARSALTPPRRRGSQAGAR